MADLTDIELARVGEYDLSTGRQKFTPAMLEDAARRARAAGEKFRAPIKLGHTDPRNDGEPAMGWLHNVRVDDDGVLRSDATGVPEWLADNAKNAYPDRSIEGNVIAAADGADGAGLEITGLALLGVTPPGITSLATWRELPGFIAAAADMPITPFAIAYAALRDTDPPVDRPAEHEKEADTMSDTLSTVLERIGLAKDADSSAVIAKVDELLEQATKPNEVTVDSIAAAHGLTAEQVTTALAAAKNPEPHDDPKLPTGMVAINASALDELKIAAQAGAEARKKQLEQERDEVISQAIAAGKVAPFRRDHWVTQWNTDPDGTKEALDGLTVVFPVAASGTPGGEAALDDAPFTDDEAATVGALVGASKEAFLS